MHFKTTVSVSNVKLRYDKKGPFVLDNVNFKIKSGSIYCLLGPSGCGKTSLLKVDDNEKQITLNLYC